MRTIQLDTVIAVIGAALAALCTPAFAQPLPAMEAVVGNNFGHLPMFVGVEKGLFKKHGLDVKLKVVNIGSQMVTSMQKNEVQIGDMSVTTFLKARHGGDPFRVIAVIQSDATRANADEPLAIVARKDSGIRPGNIEDLKGKRIALSKGQTSDEYLKMVLARRNMKYEDVQIVDIGNGSQAQLATLLKEGKADASVCWEPFNTMVLEQAADSYVVVRGGGHMSYIMIATTHEPTLKASPDQIRSFVAGLAAASQYTRKNRAEAVDIFAKWVPGLDPAVGRKAIQHISYDPRISAPVMQAFEAAEDDVLKNTLKDAQRLNVPDLFAASYMADVQKSNPEYFSDLPPLKP
ncbi:MAG: aliphatic sulfonates transporter substrate-binding protein [Betaproteobacteria bacterium]|nr:aliphatic sulfonates transporter substrate-binding protein [Betaproteobacteria bacterium]